MPVAGTVNARSNFNTYSYSWEIWSILHVYMRAFFFFVVSFKLYELRYGLNKKSFRTELIYFWKICINEYPRFCYVVIVHVSRNCS